MTVFSKESEVQAWGPTASVDVKMSAFGGGLDKASFLVNLSVGAREIADIRQCFNEMTYIYALGNDQSSCKMALTFAVFIGRENCKGNGNNTKIIGDWLDEYEEDRISKKTDPVAVTIGDFSRMCWVEGISIGNVDALRGICYVTISLIMELKKS